MADSLFRLAQRALGNGQTARPILQPGALAELAEPTFVSGQQSAVSGQRSAELVVPPVRRVSHGPAPTPRLSDAPVRHDERIRRKPLSVATPPVARQPLVPPPSISRETGHDAAPVHKAAAAPSGSTRQPDIDRRPAPHVVQVGRVSTDGREQRSAVSGQPSAVSLREVGSPADVAPPPLRLVAPQPVDQQPTPAPDGAPEAFIVHRSSLIAQPLLLVPQPHAANTRRGEPPTGVVRPDTNGRPLAGQSPIVNRQLPIPRGAEARPVVKVTIGRVEVRAVTSSAPVPPRAAPPRARKTLSLDEYLGQRNRGER